MTNFEAVIEIIQYCWHRGETNEITTETYNEAMKIIKNALKDLEILEILKKLDYIVYLNGGGDKWEWHLDTKHSEIITEEEATRIKQWKKK